MTRDDLIAHVAGGAAVDYVFFWKHTPVVAEVDARCLSQWAPYGFVVDGVTYPTAEHFMMAEKARLFGDEDTRAQILKATDPKKVKALGREVKGFDGAAWEKARFDVVVRGSRAKFSDERLRAYLLSTKPRVLVEASPLDAIWGIGLAEDHVDARTPSKWPGLNLLGFALMQVRNGL
jgi:ribA/ribD-fused uncharacterized protein